MDDNLLDDYQEKGLHNLVDLYNKANEFNKTHPGANLSIKDNVKWILRGYCEQRVDTIDDNDYVKILSAEELEAGQVKMTFAVNLDGIEKSFVYTAKAVLNSTGHIMVIEDDIIDFCYN